MRPAVAVEEVMMRPEMTMFEQDLMKLINTKYKDKFIANQISEEGFSHLTALHNKDKDEKAARVLITNLDKWFSEKHKMYNLIVYGCHVGKSIVPICYAVMRSPWYFNSQKTNPKFEDKILFLFKDRSDVNNTGCDNIRSSVDSSAFGKEFRPQLTKQAAMLPKSARLQLSPEFIQNAIRAEYDKQINSCFTFKSFISSDSPDGDSYSLVIVQVKPSQEYMIDFFNMLSNRKK